MTIIGVTGSRDGVTPRQRAALQVLLAEHLHPGVELHHGDCIGADAIAADLAKYIGYLTYAHPPVDNRFRGFHASYFVHDPLPYRERNQGIVDAVDLLIALPSGTEEDQPRSGTWMTVRMARRRGIRVEVLRPSGEAE